ncbi:MAG: hypothetical protein M1832_004449 [Thelocarpon impressellum]|nr:MAG: hypothetical protein M1832_004449 [Thelocarpon impressellum]
MGTKPRESDTIDIRKIAKLDPPPNVQEIHSILLELTQFLIDESREDDLQDFIDFTEPLPQAPRLPAQVPTSPRITSGDVCEEPEEISGVEQQTADEETSAWPEIPSVSDCSTNEQDSVCSRIQTDVSLSADLSSSFNLPARPIEPRLVDVASRRFEEEHFRRLIMAGATVAGVRGDTSGYSLPSEAPIDTDEDAYWCAIRKLICLTPSSQQPAASADLTVEEFEALEQAYREGFNPLNLDLESEPVLYDPRFLYDNSELSRALEAAQADGSPTSMPFRSPGANTDISGPSDYSTEGASNSPCPDVCWYREVFYLREGVEKINLGRRYGSRGR